MSTDTLIHELYASIGEACITAPDIAHVEVHGNRVLGMHLVPGLEVEADERPDGIRASVRVKAGARIEQPVRICFGLMPERGEQRISMETEIEAGGRVAILAACSFPNAEEILHRMDAEIRLKENAEYLYLERHVHGPDGGVEVVPKAKVELGEGARFRTDFELIKGRVGSIDIDYEAVCQARSLLEMSARVSGRGDDRIRVSEKAELVGEHAHGVLTTNIAVRDSSVAEILNTIVASAPFSRGHVDCKEIVKDQAVAHAVPVVEVRDARAYVTHEAAIGSVDSKQLETLMSRGLSNEEATDLIIEGLLSPSP